MAGNDKIIRVYQDLAEHYNLEGEAPVRDRFLVLAADTALNTGQHDQAEHLRGRLLQLNPHHLLKPYSSMAEAVRSPDVQSYVTGLRRTYPPEAAEHLLESARSKGTEPKPSAGTNQAAQPVAQVAGQTAASTPNEPLKVFRLQDPAEGSKPATRALPSRPEVKRAVPSPAPATAGSPPVPKPQAPAGRPATTPDIYRLRAESTLRGAKAASPGRRFGEPQEGAWICSALFLFTLGAGLALLAYTLAGPFLLR